MEFRNQLRDLITSHIERLCQTYAAAPGFAVTLRLVKKLLDQEKLDYTVGAIDGQLAEAIGKRKHVFSSKSFSDLLLVVSTIPAFEVERAREFFAPAGYVHFLESHGLHLAPLTGKCAAHWTFCVEPEGNRGIVHLTFFPDFSQAPKERSATIFAHDLLTPSEKASLHLE